MPLHHISGDELRSFCRQKLETCELWLRRLIHEQFLSKFGPRYFDEGKLNGNPLIGKDMRERAVALVRKEPTRFARNVDALLFDDLIALVCKHDVYQHCFADGLKTAFPLGNEMARHVLGRLVPVRNALSHANHVSVRDAERVVCYTGDVIASLKQYYAAINMNSEYNSPRFTRFSDSLGNSAAITASIASLNFHRDSDTRLMPGEQIRLTVEVDASFDSADYDVIWCLPNIGGESETGTSYCLRLTERHVGDPFIICVQLISKRNWHRHQTRDAQIDIRCRVLPPNGG